MSRRYYLSPPPERGNPLVKQLFGTLRDRRVHLPELQKKAGMGPNSVTRWRRGTDPRLSYFQAVLNALGYDLKIVELDACQKGEKTTPEKIRGACSPSTPSALS